MNIWVAIPAYNESKTIGSLLKKVKKQGFSVIVVDDGSADNTHAVARDYADVVLRNPTNLGKGMCIQEAITYLIDNTDFEYVITMDADGQHSPQELKSFAKEAERGECLVVGNRMVNPVNMPLMRFITNNFMSWFISRTAKQNIPDTQCGFRMIKRDVFERIKIETSKFEIESEMIIKAAAAGFKIKSIPVQSIYFKVQKSKIHPFVDTLRFVRFVYRLKNARN